MAVVLLSTDYRTVPQAIVPHRTFHGKFTGIPIDHDKDELALRH
jgi:hypothetical protein